MHSKTKFPSNLNCEWSIVIMILPTGREDRSLVLFRFTCRHSYITRWMREIMSLRWCKGTSWYMKWFRAKMTCPSGYHKAGKPQRSHQIPALLVLCSSPLSYFFYISPHRLVIGSNTESVWCWWHAQVCSLSSRCNCAFKVIHYNISY